MKLHFNSVNCNHQQNDEDEKYEIERATKQTLNTVMKPKKPTFINQGVVSIHIVDLRPNHPQTKWNDQIIRGAKPWAWAAPNPKKH